jgi:hypothetical protein
MTKEELHLKKSQEFEQVGNLMRKLKLHTDSLIEAEENNANIKEPLPALDDPRNSNSKILVPLDIGELSLISEFITTHFIDISVELDFMAGFPPEDEEDDWEEE